MVMYLLVIKIIKKPQEAAASPTILPLHIHKKSRYSEAVEREIAQRGVRRKSKRHSAERTEDMIPQVSAEIKGIP